MSPRVSVLIPTYDHAAFLPRALESLRAQEEQRWEGIVIDDGSPDGTREVVRAYLGDPRLSYHGFRENQGLGSLGRRLDIGVFFSDFEQLRAQLEDVTTMGRLRESAWRQRQQFTFDYHADRLIEFLRRVIRTCR